MQTYNRVCCVMSALLMLFSFAACDALSDLGIGMPNGGSNVVQQPSIELENNYTTQSESSSGSEQQSTAPEKQTEIPTERPSQQQTTEQSPDAPDGAIVVPSEYGYTYPELQEDLAALADKYGDVFSYQSIGKSVDGREIYACTVGNPNAERKILLTGGTHGKEYLSSLLVMTQIEYYLANRESGIYNGLSYADLLQECAFYVLPMINPDGIMLALCGIASMQTPEARASVEKVYADNLRDGLTTADDIDVYLAYNWKANANGVDLNRNFALSNWSEVRTGILSPCFRNYKGPSAASEPETKAVSAYVESLGEIEALLAYHTAGQVVYWDCGMTGSVRQKTLDLARAVCEQTGYKLIYDTHLDASFNDWITLEKGVPSVTVEIANVIYPMPTSELADAFEQTKQLWVTVAQLFG